MQREFLRIIFVIISVFIVSALLEAEAETVSQFVTSEEVIREQMITISRELNVTCAECHNVQNFKSDEKKSFKVAREHIKLTQMIKEHGFSGNNKEPASTCYMCHRGKLIPDYIEPKDKKSSEHH